MLEYKSPVFADVYRDGGSYGFGFVANDGNIYELHLQVVLDSPADCRRYHEPLIFSDSCSSKSVVAHPSWKDAWQMIKAIKYQNERFKELKWIIENGGWAVAKSN